MFKTERYDNADDFKQKLIFSDAIKPSEFYRARTAAGEQHIANLLHFLATRKKGINRCHSFGNIFSVET